MLGSSGLWHPLVSALFQALEDVCRGRSLIGFSVYFVGRNRCFFNEVEMQLEQIISVEEAKQLQQSVQQETAVQAAPSAKKGKSNIDEFSISSLMTQAAARKHAQQGNSSPVPPRKKPKLAVSKRDQILTEWGLYKDDLVSEEDVEKEGGALGWWAKAQWVYPHVAILARKYLAVQASSAASERVFSVGLVVTKTRNRLSGDRVADIVFLHESMKHNLW